MPPRISVVVPVFNAGRHLAPSLNSVAAAVARYGNAELILVDNGSTDGSYEALRSGYGRVARICQIRDRTIGHLRNHGARLARGSVLSFIDADCVIPDDYFASAVAVFEAVDPDACGSRYELPSDPHWIEETWQRLHGRSRDGYAKHIDSGNLLIKKTVFDRIGGFRETLVAGEDSEFCQRLLAAGFTLYESPRIAAVHLGNPKSLSAFVRKQVWHGLGMVGTARGPTLDKPITTTVLHLVALLAALVVGSVAPAELPVRLALALGLTTVVPLAAVVYRTSARRGLYRPLRSLFLYHLYFDARIYALALLLSGRASGRRGR